MSVWTRAVIGVHLMYKSQNDEDNWQEMYKKTRAIESEVEKRLTDAGISAPTCDFGSNMDTTTEAVAIGTCMREHGFFSESSVSHSEIPVLTDAQMKVINDEVDFVERRLMEIGGFSNFKRTVGLAIHATS